MFGGRGSVMSVGMRYRLGLRGGLVIVMALIAIAAACAGALFHQGKAYADQALKAGAPIGKAPTTQQ